MFRYNYISLKDKEKLPLLSYSLVKIAFVYRVLKNYSIHLKSIKINFKRNEGKG